MNNSFLNQFENEYFEGVNFLIKLSNDTFKIPV